MEKIHVLICCGGGFSSSFMAKNVAKGIKEKGYDDKMDVTFSPFDISHDKWDWADIVMCCPHLAYQIKPFLDLHEGCKIPYYILPSRMYGTMYAEDIYEDAIDVIAGFSESHENPWHFPNEPDSHFIPRTHSYRREGVKA